MSRPDARTLRGGADGLPDAAVELDVLARGRCGRRRSCVRSAASARPSAARNDSTSAARSQPQPYSAAACAKSRPCGVAMCSTNASPSPAAGRKWKIPPPSLSISTIDELQPQPRRGQQPADVVRQRDVADQQHDRARAPAAATPNAVETVPSIPLAPRLESTRNGAAAPGRTSRRRAPASRRRRPASPRPGSREPSSAATRGSLSSGPRRDAIAPAAARSAACQASSHAVPAPLGQPRGQLLEGRARVGGDDRADRAGGVLPGGLGVEADLQRVERRPARCAAAWRWAGRRRAGRGPACADAATSGAQQRVVVRDRGRPAARARQRVGQQRDARAVGERGERRAEPRVALGTARRRPPAARAADCRMQALDSRRRPRAERARPRTHGRPPSRPGRSPRPAPRRRPAPAARAARSSGARARAARRRRSRTRGRRAAAASARARATPG